MSQMGHSRRARGSSGFVHVGDALKAEVELVLHCERSEAIQLGGEPKIASSPELVIGPATSGRTRWLLAMTR
jgi:hypothetical protein